VEQTKHPCHRYTALGHKWRIHKSYTNPKHKIPDFGKTMLDQIPPIDTLPAR
jgi:hypothetical protein